MEAVEYERMAESERTHFWFVATRSIVLALLKQRIPPLRFADARVLDLGCGTGYTLGRMRESGHTGLLVGADLTPLAVRKASRDHRDAALVCASATELPFADQSFDVVLALDVLEHVIDDRQAAGEILRVLQPGGWLLATVPAWRFLWSDHDHALHHVRRYRRRELEKVLSGAGFRVEYLSYYNAALFAPIAGVRLAQRQLRRIGLGAERVESDVRQPAELINTILREVLAAERFAIGKLRLPIGVSLIALARKL